VLSHLGDDVVAALAVHFRDALDGEVVALGGAGGEMISLAVAPMSLAICSRPVHGLLCLPPKMVAARRVAELVVKLGHHRFQNPRIEGAGGVITIYMGSLTPAGTRYCWSLYSSLISILICSLRSWRRGKTDYNVNGNQGFCFTCPDHGLFILSQVLNTDAFEHPGDCLV